MSSNYKIDGISVNEIIQSDSNNSSYYNNFPVTSNSINYRDGSGNTTANSGNWKNSYGNEGQATYRSINDSDIKFPYTFVGNNRITDMSQYCIGYKETFNNTTVNDGYNINTIIGDSNNSNTQFKHISILATGGAGGGGGGGGGGYNGAGKKNSGGQGTAGGLPGIIAVVDYLIPSDVSNISYTIGAGGTGGNGGNAQGNKAGKGDNGASGNTGGTTNITIGSTKFTANGGPGGSGANAGTANKSGNTNSNIGPDGGNGVIYMWESNQKANILYNTDVNSNDLISGTCSNGNNMYDINTNICSIGSDSLGYDEYSFFGQLFDVPYNSKYLTPGLGGNVSKNKGGDASDGANGQIQIWLKYDYYN